MTIIIRKENTTHDVQGKDNLLALTSFKIAFRLKVDVSCKLLIENSAMIQENILGRWNPRAFSEEQN